LSETTPDRIGTPSNLGLEDNEELPRLTLMLSALF